jgi:hypothetical protein
VVRAYNLTLHDLEIQATKKYGSYKTVEYNEDFRMRVLGGVYEHFASSQEPIYTVGVLQCLGLENNTDNRRFVGNALMYWREKNAIKAISSPALRVDFPHVAVTGITSIGTDRVEGLHQSAVAVHHEYHITGGTVGVVGTMNGGVVTQNIGASLNDLAAALEQLRDEMRESDDCFAPVVEATAEKAASLARTQPSDRGALERILGGLGQTLQSVAAAPQAWAFIAVEAAKAGFNIPGPPLLPH